MTNLESILIKKYPQTDQRMEGCLVFLKQYGVIKIDSPALYTSTSLDFYKVKFFTGYRKFTIIDVVLGLSKDNEVFLLTSPLFSEKYSTLIKQFETIKEGSIDQFVLSELIRLYRETGVNITSIKNHKYQIWFGESRWRILHFELNDTLKIKTIPNSNLEKAFRWWQKFFSTIIKVRLNK